MKMKKKLSQIQVSIHFQYLKLLNKKENDVEVIPSIKDANSNSEPKNKGKTNYSQKQKVDIE